MDSTNHYHMSVTVAHTPKPSLKRSHSDMRRIEPPLRWIDEEFYRNTVLQIPPGTNEKEMDWKLKQEAEEYGINQLQIVTNLETITSSLSATTIASDPTNPSSDMSQSTGSTSCSSNDTRPVTSSTHRSEQSTPVSATPSFLSDIVEKRRNSTFRNGFRKMTGFSRKRKSATVSSTTLTSIESQGSDADSIAASKDMDTSSLGKSIETQSISSSQHNAPARSPSIRSNKSSTQWSPRLSTIPKSSFDQPLRTALVDHEALKRSMECDEIMAIRNKQLEERRRFLSYQLQMISDLRQQRDEAKSERKETHRRVVEQQIAKTEGSVEDLELRQLEEEVKVHKEHEMEKRSILTRLRHMEAYCQTPSPPPTPVDLSFSMSGSDRSSSSNPRDSADSISHAISLPERRVTDKDYHNLAACYRERDAMDNLHAAKINVLRGKQKRAVEAFVLKKDREIENLEEAQQEELHEIDREFRVQEDMIKAEFTEKRTVLEKRWRLQARIAKVKMERQTGLKYEPLPYVTAEESEADRSVTRNIHADGPCLPQAGPAIAVR